MSVSLTRKCQTPNCTRPANRYVLGLCDFRNQWSYRGLSLCHQHMIKLSQHTRNGLVSRVTSRIDHMAELHTDRPVHTPVAVKPRCRKCNRVLRSEESIKRGYGKHCARMIREAAVNLDGYSDAQISSALELLEDTGVISMRDNRIYMTVSTDGTRIHRTTKSACTCPAGIRGIRCYHTLSVLILGLAA